MSLTLARCVEGIDEDYTKFQCCFTWFHDVFLLFIQSLTHISTDQTNQSCYQKKKENQNQIQKKNNKQTNTQQKKQQQHNFYTPKTLWQRTLSFFKVR